MHSTVSKKPLCLYLISLTAIHLNFLLDLNVTVSKCSNDARQTVKTFTIKHLFFPKLFSQASLPFLQIL